MPATPKQRPRIFYGWYIVLAHMAIHFYMSVIVFYGMGVFLGPILKAFPWTRAQFSFAIGLQRIEGSVASPIIGFIVDRFGSKRVVWISVVLMSGGLILMSQVQSLTQFYLANLVVAAGVSGAIGIPYTVPIAHWFNKKRGRAMGVMFSGPTISGIFLPLIVLGIAEIGWRPTLLICGIGVLGVGIPGALIVRDRPERYGYFPDGDSTPRSFDLNPDYGLPLVEALKTRSFWLITMIFGLVGMGPSAMLLHQVPYFESIGFSTSIAATTVATMLIFSGFGRIFTGFLLDYMDLRKVLLGLIVLHVAGLLLLLRVTAYWHTLAYAVLFGISFGGTIPAGPILAGVYFGTRSFGAITGLIQSLGVVGGVLAPVLLGAIYDSSGTYSSGLIILAVLIGAAIPLVFLLPKPLTTR
jgi:MFS family permease